MLHNMQKEMLQTGSENNLRIAYYILVQPEVRQYLDPDSIDYYFDKYLEITESHYNASRTTVCNYSGLYV